MQLLTVLLLAIPVLSLANPQSGLIGLEPLDPKLLTDLNQYVPAKRNKFKWEIKHTAKGTECLCPEPQCPSYLNDASVSGIAESDDLGMMSLTIRSSVSASSTTRWHVINDRMVDALNLDAAFGDTLGIIWGSV